MRVFICFLVFMILCCFWFSSETVDTPFSNRLLRKSSFSNWRGTIKIFTVCLLSTVWWVNVWLDLIGYINFWIVWKKIVPKDRSFVQKVGSCVTSHLLATMVTTQYETKKKTYARWLDWTTDLQFTRLTHYHCAKRAPFFRVLNRYTNLHLVKRLSTAPNHRYPSW